MDVDRTLEIFPDRFETPVGNTSKEWSVAQFSRWRESAKERLNAEEQSASGVGLDIGSAVQGTGQSWELGAEYVEPLLRWV